MKLASEAPFPYGFPGRICYLELVDGHLAQLSGRGDLREATARAVRKESVLYAAWPGEYRTDLFHIDQPELLADAIHVPTPNQPEVP